MKGPEVSASNEVVRFSLAERLAHWNHAITFLVLLVTGAALVVSGLPGLLGPDTLRLFGQIHRWAAWPFTFLTVPILLLGARPAVREWLRECCTWDADDRRFLRLFPREFFGLHVELPPQGKFNAGEKVNSLLQIAGYPVMVITGWMLVYRDVLPRVVVMWAQPIHTLFAFLLGAAALGHIYLAVGHPGSRAALSGIITGKVSRDFARSHHRKWYESLIQLGERAAGGPEPGR